MADIVVICSTVVVVVVVACVTTATIVFLLKISINFTEGRTDAAVLVMAKEQQHGEKFKKEKLLIDSAFWPWPRNIYGRLEENKYRILGRFPTRYGGKNKRLQGKANTNIYKNKNFKKTLR